MTFAVLVLVGLLMWTLSTPAVAVLFFGEPGYEAAYGSPIYGFLGLPLLALLPLVAGFALRQGILHVGLGSGIGACAGGRVARRANRPGGHVRHPGPWYRPDPRSRVRGANGFPVPRTGVHGSGWSLGAGLRALFRWKEVG